jgi:hypothetical protein
MLAPTKGSLVALSVTLPLSMPCSALFIWAETLSVKKMNKKIETIKLRIK